LKKQKGMKREKTREGGRAELRYTMWEKEAE
jgi:hypothetical protein